MCRRFPAVYCCEKPHLVFPPPPLVAPYRAILRYYRCDPLYRAMLFKGAQHSPKIVRYPPLVLNFTQAHLCDTPFCNVSRDNCAIPHKNKHERVLRYYPLQVSRDMKSIAAGPLVFPPPPSARYRDPKVGAETSKLPKVVWRGCKRCFGQLEKGSPKSLLHQCNPVVHHCNRLLVHIDQKTFSTLS